VFSEIARPLPRPVRDALLSRYHRPHWDQVRAAVDAARGVTLHVAVHSFTPVWKGASRRFTIGLLYDPKRRAERLLAGHWQRALSEALSTGVRRNAPYRGDTDGLTTALRLEYGPDRYLGLEIELNQRALADPCRRRRITAALVRVLERGSDGRT
jgi:predicted N-formylglutamate amidohydrolase